MEIFEHLKLFWRMERSSMGIVPWEVQFLFRRATQAIMPHKPQRKTKGVNNILKFSGLAFQMIAFILVCTYLGYKIDEWLNLTFPIFMIVFILLSIIGYMLKLIKSV